MRTVFILIEIRFWISFLPKVIHFLKWTSVSAGITTSVMFVKL